MLSKIKIISLSIVIVCLFAPATSFGAISSKKICVSSKGAIVLRNKCKRSEKVYSGAVLAQAIGTAQEIAGAQGTQGPVGSVGAQGSQGPQGIAGNVKGPKGKIDFSGCRLSSEGYDSNLFNPSNPILYAEAYCNPSTEFILEDEYKVNVLFSESNGTDIAIQTRSPYTQNIGGDIKEYGVGIFANRINIVGTGTFELKVRAVCCPR